MDERTDNVETALTIVLEEIDDVIEFIRQGIATLSQNSEFTGLHRLADQAIQVQAFRVKVQTIQEEWDNIFPDTESIETVSGQTSAKSRRKRKTPHKHLAHGLRTPVGDFYIPVLRVLVKMGGKGQGADILGQVGRDMKSQLNEFDFQPLPSNKHVPRWNNAAQWARYYMVQQGLLASGSPRGIWEITKAGKLYLETNGRVKSTS